MFSSSSFRQALREVAPNLSKRYFSCQAQSTNLLRRQLQPSRKIHLSAEAFQTARTQLPVGPVIHRCGLRSSARLLRAVQGASKNVHSSSGGSFFPETSSNAVAYWLLASAASVFGIVVFGGLTRLTESGLSITEWKPVTGSLPPMSTADWEAEFAKYRASPEFLILNSRMTLDEFKNIYWMEWIHRVWGRVVGLSFVLPAVYFVARGRVSKRMVPQLAGIAGLIGFQGFLGWWMVKSGLKDDFLSPDRKPGRDVPRVSQYRLAAHLGTAFVAYLTMLWCGLTILRTNRLISTVSSQTPKEAAGVQNQLLQTASRIPRFRLAVAALLGLTFTTAMSGALVAGLDAGLIYNEFPYMGLGLTPPMSELFDPFYSHDPTPAKKDLIWRNFLENPSLVQLDHRILATTTFTAVHVLWAWSKFSSSLAQNLPRIAKRGVHGVVGFVWLQAILGICTLIYMVPIPLASAHQAGALALLTWTTVLFRRVTVPKEAIEVLGKRAGLAILDHGRAALTAHQQAQSFQALQAGAGSASAAALGSIFLAGQLQERQEKQGGQMTKQRFMMRDEQLDFLRRQRRGFAVTGQGHRMS